MTSPFCQYGLELAAGREPVFFGGLVGTQPLAAIIQARGNALHVGADATPAQFYRGLLDEVRIYNRALTSSEVQTDMATAVPP